ncbi:MAG: thioredoxin domain-containing protein [Deltaproteobacteria bacterium]
MKIQNRLIQEKSPYLLQHAENPVDWYPWGEEAFEKARREDKPILLSIGYSTCHWCHVMERESFEDGEVARLMNETFVSIKVDREERPDIDNIYMTVCQMLSKGGGCGWPLNIIMTPDKKPFFAGTYFPKESRHGRVGMTELLPRIREIWTTRRAEVADSAEQITQALGEMSRAQGGSKEETPPSLTIGTAFEELRRSFDSKNGGFSRAPKFPTPHNLLFLLRYWKRSKDDKALGMVEQTLQKMRQGGIYDHIGFGFHRYSTDEKWLVPHFEKMLYDQAMLAIAYTEAYQATGKGEYEATAREIFAYVERDMTSPEGGFYSAEDADSEGEEGRFYVWSEGELRTILGAQEAAFIAKVFNADKDGNFRDEASGKEAGHNILHLTKPLPDIAKGLNIAPEEIEYRVETARAELFAAREKRIHPHKDDKILTDWNGMMIAALAKGASAFDEPKYAETAKRAADFLLTEMRGSGGGLLHRFRGGESGIKANLDDYAYLVWGLIELYEATFEVKYLEAALALNDYSLKRFWDDAGGGFYFTPDDGEKLIARSKEIYDGAHPSGNSTSALNLLRLGRMSANSDLEKKSDAVGRAFSKTVNQFPAAYTMLMSALDFASGGSVEVVIAADAEAHGTRQMLKALRREFIPNKVVLLTDGRDNSEIAKIAEFAKHQVILKGRATAYVCLNYQCNLPTNDPEQMLKLLGIEK